MHTPLGLTAAQRWFLRRFHSSPAPEGHHLHMVEGLLPTCHGQALEATREPKVPLFMAAGLVPTPGRTTPLTSTFPQAAVTYSCVCDGLVAAVTHPHFKLEATSSGMGRRLELHLPQTAFPHLRQWCWRERKRAHCACAPPRARNAQAWPTAPGADAQREAPSALEAREPEALLSSVYLRMRTV